MGGMKARLPGSTGEKAGLYLMGHILVTLPPAAFKNEVLASR